MFREHGLPDTVAMGFEVVPHIAPDPVTNKIKR